MTTDNNKLEASLDAIRRAAPAIGARGEPSRALLSFLEIPFRLDLSEELHARVGTLYAHVRSAAADTDWRPIYREAIALGQAVAIQADADILGLQERSLTAGEEAENKTRNLAGTQSQADEAQRDAQRAVQRVAREWSDRIRRQLDHVRVHCTAEAERTLETEGIIQDPECPPAITFGESRVALRLDERWWARYSKFVADCCANWTQQTVSGVEDEIRRGVTASALVQLAPRSPVPRAGEGAPIATQNLLGGHVPPQRRIDVPGLIGATFMKARSFAFGIMGVAMLAGIFGFAIKNSFKEAHPVIVLPAVCLLFSIAAWQAVVVQRKEREKGIAAELQAADAYVRKELDRMLEAHRGKLDRHTQQRALDWEQALGRFFTEQVKPRLQTRSTTHAQEQREMKLRAAALAEQLSKVRSGRSSLQNTLVELQARARDLDFG